MAQTYAKDTEITVPTAPSLLFEFLDDPALLGGHMEKPSLMSLGASMKYDFDDKRGREVGSVIEMHGRALGLKLSIKEKIIERTPPWRKVWETIGQQRMIVIKSYRLGFEISESDRCSTLRIFIDYDLPDRGIRRLLGAALGHAYARWCVVRMARDAAAHFESHCLE